MGSARAIASTQPISRAKAIQAAQRKSVAADSPPAAIANVPTAWRTSMVAHALTRQDTVAASVIVINSAT